MCTRTHRRCRTGRRKSAALSPYRAKPGTAGRRRDGARSGAREQRQRCAAFRRNRRPRRRRGAPATRSRSPRPGSRRALPRRVRPQPTLLPNRRSRDRAQAGSRSARSILARNRRSHCRYGFPAAPTHGGRAAPARAKPSGWPMSRWAGREPSPCRAVRPCPLRAVPRPPRARPRPPRFHRLRPAGPTSSHIPPATAPSRRSGNGLSGRQPVPPRSPPVVPGTLVTYGSYPRPRSQPVGTAMNAFRSCLGILCLVPAMLSLMPAESRGWSAEGHMIAALVADRLLQARDAAAHKKLAELLATDKSNTWTKTDIASEATWADVLLEKSPEGRAATAKWHYVKLDAINTDLTK